MSLWKRLLLRFLWWMHGFMAETRKRLQEEHEAVESLRARHKACAWLKDGAWVRITAVACPRCKEWSGQVVRVKRFTTEAQSVGEWVFDRPSTGFCCAPGTSFEPAHPIEAKEPAA